MNEQKGIIVLFMLVTFASMLLLGTAVFYQSFYAYSAAIKRVQYTQHVYVLDGLVNHGIALIRNAERAHAPLTRAMAQSYTPWQVSKTGTYNGTLLITPTKSGDTLMAQITHATVQLTKGFKYQKK